MAANFESVVEAIENLSLSKRKPLSHIDTGTGTTFKTLIPGVPFKLLEIRFKTAALAAAETLSFTRTRLYSVLGMATYVDHVIYSEDLGTLGVTSVVVTFGGEEAMFFEYDSIVPALSANTGSDRWGLEILYELV